MNTRNKRADALAQKALDAAEASLPVAPIVVTFEAPWDERTREREAESQRILAEVEAGRMRYAGPIRRIHVVNAPGPEAFVAP